MNINSSVLVNFAVGDMQMYVNELVLYKFALGGERAPRIGPT